jgi:hypothetical protein
MPVAILLETVAARIGKSPARIGRNRDRAPIGAADHLGARLTPALDDDLMREVPAIACTGGDDRHSRLHAAHQSLARGAAAAVMGHDDDVRARKAGARQQPLFRCVFDVPGQECTRIARCNRQHA